MLEMVIRPLIDNPLDGILPDFTIFGTEFTALWQKVVAAAWGIAIILSIIFLLIGLTQMHAATNAANPQEHKQARTKTIAGVISLAALASLAVIVGAILAFVG